MRGAPGRDSRALRALPLQLSPSSASRQPARGNAPPLRKRCVHANRAALKAARWLRFAVRAFRFGDWMLLPTLGAGGWLYGFLQSGSSMAWGQKYTWSSHPRFISGTRVGVFSVFGAYLISFHTR